MLAKEMTDGQKRREERRLAIIEKYNGGTSVSDLATVDWTLPLKQIAEQVGLSIPRIAQIKRALRLTKHHPIGYDWSQIDWSKHNSQIAQEIGCGIDAVQINRPYEKK
jgi:hypothetical protein